MNLAAKVRVLLKIKARVDHGNLTGFLMPSNTRTAKVASTSRWVCHRTSFYFVI